jgi:hypothetical protein
MKPKSSRPASTHWRAVPELRGLTLTIIIPDAHRVIETIEPVDPIEFGARAPLENHHLVGALETVDGE